MTWLDCYSKWFPLKLIWLLNRTRANVVLGQLDLQTMDSIPFNTEVIGLCSFWAREIKTSSGIYAHIGYPVTPAGR